MSVNDIMAYVVMLHVLPSSAFTPRTAVNLNMGTHVAPCGSSRHAPCAICHMPYAMAVNDAVLYALRAAGVWLAPSLLGAVHAGTALLQVATCQREH